MQFALCFDVLLAVAVEPIEPLLIIEPVYAGRVFALARLPRLRHLVHQPFASGVFAVFQLQRISRGAQPCRQPDRQAHRHGAAVALERNERPADAGCSTCCSMAVSKASLCAATTPARIRRSFEEFRRNGVAWAPQLHGAVVDGIRRT